MPHPGAGALPLLAVGLATLGAVLFGLAAVRQHGAVRSTLSAGRDRPSGPEPGPAGRARLLAGWAVVRSLLRNRAWRVGVGQAGLGGVLHVAALTLAPITLVQPVGVLAVPVTVVRSALGRGRRPGAAQVVGAAVSVVGVAALTVVLLVPGTHAAVLPLWTTLAGAVAAVVGAAAVLSAALRRAPELVGCVARATSAAALFGLTSLLVRTLGQVATTRPGGWLPLTVVAVLGLASALPLGLWCTQGAYAVGAPQVVVCCLTLVDPVTAVVGGRLLLRDGAALGGVTLLLAVGCGLLAAVGVVLLAAHGPEAGRLPAAERP
ncbi:hypothetical protein SAMN04488544_0659 [Microlunatus sagamiharensis]|uniref:Magnesium transporter NIPA n=1 Tax=Microlunatus sagamiharensis TaxID=546874 RepID=A0A1H2LQR7_9ACTN|nr:hypothetical protein [Microlunatus sagamiharensis]SDU83279.1 hypothetical protein SAMN04488544_0659 [Microlunatus sagamiharensis]